MSHQNLDLAALLHQKGYRLTPQRQMVLDAICEANGHATPEQVFERVGEKSEAVNRATVYRTLKFLQTLKLVAVTTLPSGHLEYEIAGSETHHHLICAECGADREISDGIYAGFVEAIEEGHGFQVETTHLTLHGLCADCLERRDPNEPTS